MKKPTIGSQVHFVLPHPTELDDEGNKTKHAHRPAIVLRPLDDEHNRVQLQVFTDNTVDAPNTSRRYDAVHYSEAHEANSWHWPEEESEETTQSTEDETNASES